MDEGAACEPPPDLRDIEVKLGRKTPEGLLRCLREEASSLRGDGKHDSGAKETGRRSLDEKIRKLKLEMAHLRSVDVKILQQLLAVHEGIEAVKWLLEERGTLTSRCSSLTSSQYSLGEGPDTSWRGSWSSLQDPNDKLDNISVGSYLDTLADDMDEYCPSSSESVICSATLLVSEAPPGGRTGGGPVAPVTAAGARAGVRCGPGVIGIQAGSNEKGVEVRGGPGTLATSGVTGTTAGKPVPVNPARAKSEGPKQDPPVWTRAAETAKGNPASKDNIKGQPLKVNGVHEKPSAQTGGQPRPLPERQGSGQSPKLKPYRNGKMDACKLNGKMHLEYDAHWRWVQSQEDVTFL